MAYNIDVVELFAGVGGFRLGLENSSKRFKTIWANQWEPNKKKQHAFDCYISHFGESSFHTNEDIGTVKNNIPKHTLLVGGFPCQDYSVARTGAKGITGKKGVLWWEINDIVKNNKPEYILLENVDRLLKSPASQRGRDFGVMLRCLYDEGYDVEWRVINAADYGLPQRRRRVFIFAYKNKAKIYKELYQKMTHESFTDYLTLEGFFARKFPAELNLKKSKSSITSIKSDIFSDLGNVSDNFNVLFYKAGIIQDGIIYTVDVETTTPKNATLNDIRLTNEVDENYFLNGSLEKWNYLKGSKKIPRKKPNGEKYFYSEGAMSFPDSINLPARTMLTSESSVNRSTHVIEDMVTGRLRLLTPIECERLNGFPDNWTDTGMPEKFRYFVMGNALVVPIVKMIGDTIIELIEM